MRDCCLRSSYDFPQSPEHCSPTKYARVLRCSHGDVVMLFCPSFTQSERFLQTDQLIIRLQVAVVTNFIRMSMRNVFLNVFKSDAVIWWAAIFRSLGSSDPSPPPLSPNLKLVSGFGRGTRVPPPQTADLFGVWGLGVPLPLPSPSFPSSLLSLSPPWGPFLCLFF